MTKKERELITYTTLITTAVLLLGFIISQQINKYLPDPQKYLFNSPTTDQPYNWVTIDKLFERAGRCSVNLTSIINEDRFVLDETGKNTILNISREIEDRSFNVITNDHVAPPTNEIDPLSMVASRNLVYQGPSGKY